MIDHDVLDRAGLRFELDAELLTQSFKERRPGFVERYVSSIQFDRRFGGPLQRQIEFSAEPCLINYRTVQGTDRSRRQIARKLAYGYVPCARAHATGDQLRLEYTADSWKPTH